MKIHDDHMYHGAALIQIAENPAFTAINSLKVASHIVRVGYKINHDIAIYLKYCSKPTSNAYREYIFTFSKEHLSELAKIAEANSKTFIALVCVKDCEICLLNHDQLLALLKRREDVLGHSEDHLTVVVTVPAGKSLRVYVNTPGKKKSILGKEIVVSRSAFPSDIFI